MPSTYSTSLRIELQADGENAGTWGQKVDNDFNLLEQSIAGWATIAISGNIVLTALNGLSDQARNAVLNLTNGGVAAPFTVTVPAHSKVYVFDNQSGQTATITGGGTTFAIPTGKRSAVYVDTSGNVAELVNGSDAFAVNNLTVATSVLSTRPVVGGSANAITLTYSPTPGSYINGQSFEFIATAANTGATTVNINALGAKALFKRTGASAAAALVGGEIQIGDIVTGEYDGTQFQMAAPAAGPTLIQTQTVTNVAAVSFVAGITSTYDEYLIVLSNLQPVTNNTGLYAQISQDAGANWKSGVSDYRWASFGYTDAGVSATAGSGGDVGVKFLSNASTTAAAVVSGEVRFYSPSKAVFKNLQGSFGWLNVANNYGAAQTAGAYIADGLAINGIRFLFDSGNIATGTFSLYGLRK